MCSIPVPPPLPPDQMLPGSYGTDAECEKCGKLMGFHMNSCMWASGYPELREACIKNNVCLNKHPYKFRHQVFESIQQVGPTCGLVALSMLLNGKIPASEILSMAKSDGFTNRGEMFSAKNLMKLAVKVSKLANIDIKPRLQTGNLFSEKIVAELLSGSTLLVPYDADFNHYPTLKQGHKAHWSLVCGILIENTPEGAYTNDPDNIYVLCKHGKSRYLAIWKLYDLAKSNGNLYEFSQKRNQEGNVYLLPEDGISGKNGLKDQFIIVD